MVTWRKNCRSLLLLGCCWWDTAKALAPAPVNRRNALLSSCGAAVMGTVTSWAIVAPRSVAHANDDDITTTTTTKFVQGTVILAPDAAVVDASLQETAALYITCRPDRPDNVPAAILSGSRGKPPPVLAARFAAPITFPFEFSLTMDNMTEEGAALSEGGATTSPSLWWKNDDLIVSARWDSDGVAATRSPEDLVGRGLLSRRSKDTNGTLTVLLQGRGSFGKFATKKS